jgi:hypothetical protein
LVQELQAGQGTPNRKQRLHETHRSRRDDAIEPVYGRVVGNRKKNPYPAACRIQHSRLYEDADDGQVNRAIVPECSAVPRHLVVVPEKLEADHASEYHRHRSREDIEYVRQVLDGKQREAAAELWREAGQIRGYPNALCTYLSTPSESCI